MSTLSPVRFPCEACSAEVAGEIVVVGNLSTGHRLATRVLERQLNTFSCGVCAHSHTVHRTVLLIDVGAKVWWHAYPRWAEVHWEDLSRSVEVQLRRNRRAAPPGGRGPWHQRVVFGYEALREKIVMWNARLDDVDVEIAKLHVLSGRPEWAGARVSLDHVDEATLWWRLMPRRGQPVGLRTPLDLLSRAGPRGFPREQLLLDAFVSMRRWFVPSRRVNPLDFDLDGRSIINDAMHLRSATDDDRDVLGEHGPAEMS